MENSHRDCPVCDQGRLRQVTIQPLAINGWLCTECEAFWQASMLPTQESFIQLGYIARQHNLSLAQLSIVVV